MPLLWRNISPGNHNLPQLWRHPLSIVVASLQNEGGPVCFVYAVTSRLLTSVKLSLGSNRSAMTESVMPTYYLTMIGGSLTIMTAISILSSGYLYGYYERFFPLFSGINQLTAFALTFLPGLAILFLGHRSLGNLGPDSDQAWGLWHYQSWALSLCSARALMFTKAWSFRVHLSASQAD